MNHTSEHDKKTKAGLVAKIIDKEGAHFSQDVFQKSKMMQQTRKLNAAQTTSMMSEVRSSDYLFRELRTGLIKEIGFSPFASQKEVDTYRKKVLVAKKDDWDFRRLKLYQHKLGNKKSLPTETPVLQVKNLESYILKMAESEAAFLDNSKKELEVCFDADAGGGRFWQYLVS